MMFTVKPPPGPSHWLFLATHSLLLNIEALTTFLLPSVTLHNNRKMSTSQLNHSNVYLAKNSIFSEKDDGMKHVYQ